MKRIMTVGAMAIALLTATSCSETETDLVIDPGNGDQVALGIIPNLKVDAGTKAATKSVVTGEAIVYDVKKYGETDYAPGLGVLITKKDVDGWYVPDKGDYTGHHVWYMGSEKGEGWKSIITKAGNFKDTKEVPYYLTKEIGCVYAYYPYDEKNNLAVPSSEEDLKIQVSVEETGDIDALANNARKYWNVTQWSTTAKNDLVNLSCKEEKDYLYFTGEKGRYVNNGRTDGEKPFNPDSEADNTNKVNPGYKINLDMKHAMSMVTFRVYDGGKLSDNSVNFTKFRIKNVDASKTDPFKMGSDNMFLKDGSLEKDPSALKSGDISRTISDYILMRQVDDSKDEGQYAFKENGTTINAKLVSKSVSAIVFPTTFSDDEVEVIITLKEGAKAAVEYPVVLPANNWEAGSNYIYTLSAGRNKLSVVSVAVTAWDDQEQDTLPL